MTAKSVLLLEDEVLVAEAIKMDLEAIGLTVLGPAFDCAAVLEILLRERPDFAIRDTHLGEQTCEVVLDECAAQAVVGSDTPREVEPKISVCQIH